nr:MAG TPA: hypothetical protein [Caudoviricetes sp.]
MRTIAAEATAQPSITTKYSISTWNLTGFTAKQSDVIAPPPRAGHPTKGKIKC